MDKAITRPLILALGLPFPAAHIILGIANLDRLTTASPAVVAMAICLVLMALLTRRGQHRLLPAVSAWLSVAGVVTMDLLVNSVLPQGEHPGYAAWQAGAIQMLMVVLALRQRIALAWLGISLFAVADLTSSLLRGLPVVDALALVLTPIMWIVIATAVSLMLTRSTTLIRDYTTQQHQAAALLAREHARQLSRNQWMIELDSATRPALELITTGRLTDRDRADLMLLEAQLRDQVRGRTLATPEILHAARQARARGVKVDILDDRKRELPEKILSEASSQLAATLGRAQQGTVNGRVLPAGSGIAVTVLAYDEATEEEEFYLEIRE